MLKIASAYTGQARLCTEENEQPVLIARYFSQITVLMGGSLLKAPVGQSSEAFPFLLLTPNGSGKHERQKEEEENARGALNPSLFFPSH